MTAEQMAAPVTDTAASPPPDASAEPAAHWLSTSWSSDDLDTHDQHDAQVKPCMTGI